MGDEYVARALVLFSFLSFPLVENNKAQVEYPSSVLFIWIQEDQAAVKLARGHAPPAGNFPQPTTFWTKAKNGASEPLMLVWKDNLEHSSISNFPGLRTFCSEVLPDFSCV